MSYTPRQRLEAAEWFFDIHDGGDPSAELLQGWLQWMAASEGNRLAFEAVETAYHHTSVDPADRNRVATHLRPEPPYSGELSVAAWRASSHAARRSGPNRIIAIAAVTLLAVIGTGTWMLQRMQSLAPVSGGEFTTRIGEHMRLVLADGSRVVLGARSHLAVEFTPQLRSVRLVSGEAYFEVHKDPGRAFAVYALNGVIAAVGTAFDVRTTEDRVMVSVSDGAVNVTQTGNTGANTSQRKPDVSSGRPPEPVHLVRGEQLALDIRSASVDVTQGRRLTHVNPSQPARWRDGWLVYQDEPLRSVIDDVERYTDRQIAVDASVPTDLRFTGAVFKDSVLEWVQALPEVFPVAIERHGKRLEVIAATRPMTAGRGDLK